MDDEKINETSETKAIPSMLNARAKAAPTEPIPTAPSEDLPPSNGDTVVDEAAPSVAPSIPAATPKRSGSPLLAGLAIVILGFGGGVGGYVVANEVLADEDTSSTSGQLPVQPSNDAPTASTSKTSSDSSSATPRDIYSRVAPAVVHIDARVVSRQSFFGIPQGEEESTGTGSGFVIDDEGHVVTNAHVIENASSLRVNFGDEASVEAKLVGMDKSSDIAVLKIDPKVDGLDGDLPTVSFGDSDAVAIGDPVLAIGNPFGLDRTLTTGVISALQRDIPSLNEFSISGVIQTDAAVNPGNSGGPLLNMLGEVIGVNSQIQSRGGGFDGIAFAVPSKRVEEVAETLIKDGKVTYAWLGVSGGELTDDLRKELNVDVEAGVVIAEVTPASPAARAGIKGAPNEQVSGGDIVIEFDGEKITKMQQLSSLVNEKKPGDTVEVKLVRAGKEMTVNVKLAERPDTLSLRDRLFGGQNPGE